MKFTDSSGRFFTDYTTNCSMYDTLQKRYAPDSTQNDFRFYLQHNAEQIMKDMGNKGDNDYNFSSSTKTKVCPVCLQKIKKDN